MESLMFHIIMLVLDALFIAFNIHMAKSEKRPTFQTIYRVLACLWIIFGIVDCFSIVSALQAVL